MRLSFKPFEKKHVAQRGLTALKYRCLGIWQETQRNWTYSIPMHETHVKNKVLLDHGGPLLSRQKEKSHGKKKNLTAKRKRLEAKRITSPQKKILTAKRKTRGKKNNLTAKRKTSTSRQKKELKCPLGIEEILPWVFYFLPWGYYFCHESFSFSRESFFFLPWGFSFFPWG